MRRVIWLSFAILSISALLTGHFLLSETLREMARRQFERQISPVKSKVKPLNSVEFLYWQSAFFSTAKPVWIKTIDVILPEEANRSISQKKKDKNIEEEASQAKMEKIF